MAGRKPPSDQTFFSTLLGKLGLQGEPAAAPPKKGKRRRKRPASGPEAAGYVPSGGETGEVSPFADYGNAGGLMDQPTAPGFDEALSYEAAAAAGYAPSPLVMPTPPAPVDPSTAPALPRFGAEAPAAPAAPAAPPPAGGKLFAEDALDNSLDALFSGLETGMAPPPIPPAQSTIETPPPPPPAPVLPATPAPPPSAAARAEERPLFDEFGLTPPQPLAPEALPTAALAPEALEPPAPAAPSPRIHKASAEAPGVPSGPAVPLHQGTAGTGVDGFVMPAPTVLELATNVDLRGLLAAIDRVPGVAGALLVGYDGLLIAATVPAEIDREYLGAQACNLFMGNKGQLDKMRRGELRRILLETASGAMLVTAADMGILVVVSHEGRAMDIGGVMGAIGGALGQA